MNRRVQRGFKQGDDEVEVSMTPMIDVVFQLLIYFLVTFSTADVLAILDVSRPAPEQAQQNQMPPADMIRIAVLEGGYAINGRSVSDEELDALMQKLAGISTRQTVLVNCDEESLHGRLIHVLDMCASHELSQIAVVSGK